jgi:hypothetical protein
VSLAVRREHLVDLLEDGALVEFDQQLEAYRTAAHRARSPVELYRVIMLDATRAAYRGDLALAEQLAGGSRARGLELQQPDVEGAYILQLFIVRYQQGRLAELPPQRQRAADSKQLNPAGLALAALALAETGKHERAALIIEHALGENGTQIPRDGYWLAAMAMLAGAAAECGYTSRFATLRDALEPCADLLPVFGSGAAVLGCVRHWLGALAAADGRIDEAQQHLDVAADRCDRLGMPYWAASARIDHASMLRSLHDESAAETLVASAIDVARAQGFGRLIVRAAEFR